MDRFKKRLGMKTQEEKVDDGLRAMRDILERMDEHDMAINIEDMMFNGSMVGKCVMLVALDKTLPLLMIAKGMIDIEAVKENMERMLRELKKK